MALNWLIAAIETLGLEKDDAVDDDAEHAPDFAALAEKLLMAVLPNGFARGAKVEAAVNGFAITAVTDGDEAAETEVAGDGADGGTLDAATLAATGAWLL